MTRQGLITIFTHAIVTESIFRTQQGGDRGVPSRCCFSAPISPLLRLNIHSIQRVHHVFVFLYFWAVMALYPQTTCFYKAVINQLPQTAQEEYQVLFEDSSYSEGFSPPLMVAQRYVITIAIKEKKK